MPHHGIHVERRREHLTENAWRGAGDRVIAEESGMIPVGDPLHGLLHKYVNVFGMSILAFEGYPDEMISHVATIAAEYLYNNDDGQVDNPALNAAIAQNHGTVVLITIGGDERPPEEWFAVSERPELAYITEQTTIGMYANKGGTQCGPECG